MDPSGVSVIEDWRTVQVGEMKRKWEMAICGILQSKMGRGSSRVRRQTTNIPINGVWVGLLDVEVYLTSGVTLI
jgi:hypothetical protein